MKEFMTTYMRPMIERMMNTIAELADKWQDVPMLARTHGQPASPTRLGKEMKVFMVRLSVQYQTLIDIVYSAKFSELPATSTHTMLPIRRSTGSSLPDNFVYDLGLELSLSDNSKSNTTTTSLRNRDALKRINTILIDFFTRRMRNTCR